MIFLVYCIVSLLCPAPNRWGIKQCFCLTSDVSLSVAYIRPKSRTERPTKTKIGTEIAYVTRDSGHKVKGQGHQAALLSAALTCKSAAAVSVGTYSTWESTWESTAMLRLFGGARGTWAPTGRRGAGAYCVATRTACSIVCLSCLPALRDILHTPMARHSLFVLKVPLSSKKPNQTLK